MKILTKINQIKYKLYKKISYFSLSRLSTQSKIKTNKHQIKSRSGSRRISQSINLNQPYEETINYNQSLIEDNEEYNNEEELLENDSFIRLNLTKIEYKSKHDCGGCGITLQYEDKNDLGYIPKEKYNLIGTTKKNEIICERCYKLQTQGQFHISISKKERISKEIESLKDIKLNKDSKYNDENIHYYASLDKLSTDDLIKLISNRLSKYSQVFYILDIVDIESSVNIDLLRMIESKQCGVTFIINKFDLLPEGNSYERINRFAGLELKSVLTKNNFLLKYSYVVVSSKTGHKMEYVLSKLKQMSRYYKEKKIYHGKPKVYIVGNCNIGKSCFINKLTEKICLSKRRYDRKEIIKSSNKEGYDKNSSDRNDSNDEIDDDSINKENISYEDNDQISKLTSSSIPGTTLNIIKVPNMSYNCSFFDTPGFPTRNNYISKLYNEYEALLSITMRQRLTTNLMIIKQNYSIYLGSLARIDMINGEDKVIGCFVSEGVTIHKTQTSNIDTIWDKGSGILLRPRVRSISQEDFSCHTFNLQCDKYSMINHDIVISGLGWISISGKGFCQIEVWAPKDIHVYKRREVLCPYETRTNNVIKLYGKTLNVKTKRNKDVYDMYQKINNKI